MGSEVSSLSDDGDWASLQLTEGEDGGREAVRRAGYPAGIWPHNSYAYALGYPDELQL